MFELLKKNAGNEMQINLFFFCKFYPQKNMQWGYEMFPIVYIMKNILRSNTKSDSSTLVS